MASPTRRGPVLPDFVIVGAQKGGTVWLNDCLREHPDVYMSPDVHEIFFFDRYFDRGVEWYARYFRGYGGQQRIGETTSTYLAHPLAPRRLRQVLPQATVIVSVRNPLDRAWSRYLHLWRKGDIPAGLSFSQACQAVPDIVASGEYFRCLRPWRELFPAERLHALVLDDARDDPFGHLRRLYQVLGVNPEFRAAKTPGRSNEHATPRSVRAAKVAYHVSRSLHRSGLHPVVERLKVLGVQRLILEGGRDTTKEPPPMSAADRERLRAHYRVDVAALSELTGRDLVRLWLDGETAGQPPGEGSALRVVVAGEPGSAGVVPDGAVLGDRDAGGDGGGVVVGAGPHQGDVVGDGAVREAHGSGAVHRDPLDPEDRVP
jgi:hypothetical protein